MVKLKIDNYEVEVPAGTSILEAARTVQIDIPTLCKHPDVDPSAGCGICIVKVNGRILRSCCTPVAEGMEIITSDPEIVNVRRTVLELILSNHPNECLTCIRSGHCELQDLSNTFGISQSRLPSLNKKFEKRRIDQGDCARSVQMHCLRPLCRGLSESAECLGLKLSEPRPGDPGYRRRRDSAGRKPLHQMWPMLGALSDRSDCRI